MSYYDVMKYLCYSTCGSMHVSHSSRDPQAYRSQGPITKATRNPQTNTARTNYRTRVVLVPALLAGDRRAQRCRQLVVARTLHCSFAVCCLWCLGYVHHTKTKSWKKKLKKKRKKRRELCEAGIHHVIKSKIGHRDHLSILPKIHILIFRGVRETHHARMDNTAE